MSARLYGKLTTQGSLAVVTEGFRQVLHESGELAGTYGVDRAYGFDEEPPDGTDAYHGVYTGALDEIGIMTQAGRHEHFWIMVAPNSDLLPRFLIDQLKLLDKTFPGRIHLMAPSRWAAEQICKNQLDVTVVPHGVDSAYRPDPSLASYLDARYQAGEFRVLHLSTSDRSRKGTVELIEAWMSWTDRPPRARLSCIMDYPAKTALMDRLVDQGIGLDQSVQLQDRVDLPPENMARVLMSAHVVCQPSRGEAFGLVPLQALCSGVPIVATVCTGHTEYLKDCPPGLVAVPTFVDAPIDDLPGSKGPGLRSESIRDALDSSYRHYQTFKLGAMGNAAALGEKWSWQNQLRHFVKAIRL